MVRAKIYLEGGGDSKEQDIRCQEGFHKLLKNCGFEGRYPRLRACGGRNQVFNAFCAAFGSNCTSYIAMLIDSEDPIINKEASWQHLKARDNWDKPQGATDDQVLFMTTCMETWIVADKAALREHYGQHLQESALPPVDTNLENKTRQDVQDRLEKATKNCSNFYKKGKRSFKILGKLNPDILKQFLPSFARTYRILQEKLLAHSS